MELLAKFLTEQWGLPILTACSITLQGISGALPLHLHRVPGTDRQCAAAELQETGPHQGKGSHLSCPATALTWQHSSVLVLLGGATPTIVLFSHPGAVQSGCTNCCSPTLVLFIVAALIEGRGQDLVEASNTHMGSMHEQHGFGNQVCKDTSSLCR